MVLLQPLYKKLKKVKLIQYSVTYQDRRRKFGRADCVVVSFPKSGRTWLRVLVARVLSQKYGKEFNIELENMADEKIPYIFMTHDKANNQKPLSSNKLKYRDKKVLFLVRDPRDVVVSYYYQCTKRLKSPVEMDMSSFIRDSRYGVDRIIGLMNIWAQKRHIPQDFLLVKYEDLHRDAVGELRRVMGFFGFEDVEEEVLKDAVEFGSFNNMKRMEQSNAFQNKRIRNNNPDDQEGYKVRQGRVGGYANTLPQEDVDYLNQRVRESLNKEYGYV